MSTVTTRDGVEIYFKDWGMELMRWLIVNDGADRYVDAALCYERSADDGWPEDAGSWPLGAPSVRPIKTLHRALRRLSPTNVLGRMLQKPNRA